MFKPHRVTMHQASAALTVRMAAGTFGRFGRGILIVVLALAIGSTIQPRLAQAASARANNVTYEVISDKSHDYNCPGMSFTYRVRVLSTIKAPGRPDLIEKATGFDVSAKVEVPVVGTISSAKPKLVGPLATVEFTFKATKPGSSNIVFTAVGKGGTTVVGQPVPVKVTECKLSVHSNSHYGGKETQNPGASFAATLDAAMVADAQGHYSGSATVNWAGDIAPPAAFCTSTIVLPTSQADLSGETDDSGQVLVKLTYQPMLGTRTVVCKDSTGSFTDVQKLSFAPESRSMTVPEDGGASTQPQDYVDQVNGGLAGSVFIDVTPEDAQAVAISASSQLEGARLSWRWPAQPRMTAPGWARP